MFRSGIVLYALLGLVLNAHESNAQWVVSGETRAVSLATSQSIDPSGNVYSSGIFTCNTTFESDLLLNNSCFEDSGQPITVGRLDAFVTKHDQLGNLVWSRQIEGSENNTLYINAMATDAAGNTYVVGEFMDTLFTELAMPLINRDTVPDGFIIKLLSDGSTDWSRQVGGSDSSFVSVQDIAIKGSELLITGVFRGKLQVNLDMDSLDDNTMFYASYGINGTANWMKNFEPTAVGATSRGKSIANVGDSTYLLMEFSDDVESNGTMLPAGGQASSSLFGINSTGDINATHIFNSNSLTDMAVTGTDSSIYITGFSSGVLTLDGGPVYGIGSRAALISLDLDGQLKWSIPITSTSNTNLAGTSISVSQDDFVLVGGTFSGPSVTALGQSATGNGDLNGFALLADSSGTVSFVQSLGGANPDAVSAVSALDQSTLYTAGYFSEYIRVVGDILEGEPSTRNAFIAQLDICPTVVAEMLSNRNTYVCEGEPVTLTVTNLPAYSYQWVKDDVVIPGEVGFTLDVSLSGAYYALLDDGAGCIKKTPSAFVGINPLPLVSNTTTDPLVNCAGDSVKLRGPSAVGIWQWFDLAGPVAGATANEFTTKIDGDYFLRAVSDSSCISYSDTLQIRFLDYPDSTLNLNSKQVICGGEEVALSVEVDPGFSYQWYKDGELITGETTSDFIAIETGIYNAFISNSIGCSSLTSSDTVVVQAAPIVNTNKLDLPGLVCIGDSVKMIADNIIGQSYQWLLDGINIPGATRNFYSAKDAGSYEVLVSNSTCATLSETILLAEDTPPPASISNGSLVVICENESTMLSANTGSGLSYRWFRKGTELIGEVEATTTTFLGGQFVVEVSNAAGCSSTSAQTVVQVNLAPPAEISSEGDPIICAGNSVTLVANLGNNFQYQWYRNNSVLNGAQTRQYLASVSGTYHVAVTNTNGCSTNSDKFEVEVIAQPVAVITTNGATSICESDSLELIASAGQFYQYKWIKDGNEIDGATEQSYYAKEQGDYQSLVYVGDCETISSSKTVNTVASPQPRIVRNVDFLSIESYPVIEWYLDEEPLGSTGQNIQVVSDGLYKVWVENANGCSAFSESVEICLPIPEISRIRDELTVSVPEREYAWLFDGVVINGATAQKLIAQQSGIYSVIVTNEEGCSMESSPAQVCIPFPEIESDPITGVLNAIPGVAKSYQWYKDGGALQGENLNALIPDGAGRYSVEITDFEDCTSISSPVVIEVVSAVNPAMNSSISFYPNPVANQLHIKLEAASTGYIFQSEGKMVSEFEIQIGEAIDVSSLDPGIYYIRILSQNEVRIGSFVKN